MQQKEGKNKKKEKKRKSKKKKNRETYLKTRIEIQKKSEYSVWNKC